MVCRMVSGRSGRHPDGIRMVPKIWINCKIAIIKSGWCPDGPRMVRMASGWCNFYYINLEKILKK